MKHIFNARIEDGQLRVVNRKDYDRTLASLSGEFTLTLAKKSRQRSNPQNRYYWSAVVPICREILKEYGYPFTPEQTHEFLKANLNSAPLASERTGEVYNVPQTTTTMTTVEFEEYLERVRVWAHDFAGVTIQLPGEQAELEQLAEN